MSENELSKALLRGQSMPDTAALTQRVIQRDRRRVMIAAVGCVIAWMLVVMLPWATVMPLMAKVANDIANAPAAGPASMREHYETAEAIRFGTMATFFGSIASMLLAAICTVAFIALSRRTTLRQVNAQLSVISDQLRTLTRS